MAKKKKKCQNATGNGELMVSSENSNQIFPCCKESGTFVKAAELLCEVLGTHLVNKSFERVILFYQFEQFNIPKTPHHC